MKRLIVFDLDGTLAESKSSLDTEMSKLLHNFLISDVYDTLVYKEENK